MFTAHFLTSLFNKNGIFLWDLICWNMLTCPKIIFLVYCLKRLTLPNIWGVQCTPYWEIVNTLLMKRFLVTDSFYFSYLLIWHILAKFHGCIISTFETMTVFRRTVLTKWWFYGRNTVLVANIWNSCKMWPT